MTSCSHNPHISCSDCRLSALCLPISLELSELNRVDEVIRRGRPLQKGEYLYHSGDELESVFAVRSGSVKALRLSPQGDEQITGFYFPGEILGLDGLGSGEHMNAALALETASVCAIPFNQLEELSRHIPSLQHHFFKLMGREINHEQVQVSLISQHTAEQRVAAFLLSLSSRFKRQSLAADRFVLSITRADIGNFLGLTVETVSRIFSQMRKDGVIAYSGRDMQIRSIEQLQSISAVTV